MGAWRAGRRASPSATGAWRRPRTRHALRSAALVAALVALAAGPVAAQQPDTSRLPESKRARILEKLRRPVFDPGRLPGQPPADSLGPAGAAEDSARAARRPAAAPAPGGGRAGIARDSLMEVLLSLEGYGALEYEGTGARFVSDSGRVELMGEATVVQAGQRMTADSLMVYDRRASVVCGYGAPVLSGQGSPVQSDQVCYDVDRRMGTALGARTEFQQGATWYLHGREVYTRGESRIYGRHTNFTSCDLDEPHYHFAAADVKMVRDSVMVARNITLNFGDVPVFWLPFMMQSMKRGRRSGVLTPDFGLNDIARTSSGYQRRISNVGFYWAINEYMGARVALGWYSENWTSLDGGLDYRWRRQFLNGNVRFRRYWSAGGRTEFALQGNTSWQPTERTSVRADGRYTSSSDFVQRNSFDPRELNRSIDSNAGITHRFDWGSLNLSARRRQFLTDNEVEWTLPNLGLNLSPITLFEAAPGQASWYNNATWNGSLGFTGERRDVDETLVDRGRGDERGQRANLSSSIRLGSFSWSQRVSMDLRRWDELVGPDAAPDSAAGVMSRTHDQVDWQTGLNYQQRLIGNTTLTPGLTLQGYSLANDSTGGEFVAAPVRLDFRAALQTHIYGFWPGVGPFSRIRHKISPSISYGYSPAPELTPEQIAVFGDREGRVRNRIRIGFNQTFEAKYARDEEPADTAASDSAAAGADSAATGSGPRRRNTAQAVTVLALQTSAVEYDFVQASEEGQGFTTTRLTNRVSSDLVRGLSLSFSHDLFRSGDDDGREFDPFLRDVNASFSVNSSSWVFRVLGLGGGGREADGEGGDAGEAAGEAADPAGEELIGELDERTSGRMIPDARGDTGEPRSGGSAGGMGDWRASLRYSLVRRRADGSLETGSQMLSGNMSFQPTEKWSVHWNTAYSFTDHTFTNHTLRLRRDLHRWEANFDFVKAQNGNFSFRFSVSLRDNPDIKVDYEQRGGALRRQPFRR